MSDCSTSRATLHPLGLQPDWHEDVDRLLAVGLDIFNEPVDEKKKLLVVEEKFSLNKY